MKVIGGRRRIRSDDKSVRININFRSGCRESVALLILQVKRALAGIGARND